MKNFSIDQLKVRDDQKLILGSNSPLLKTDDVFGLSEKATKKATKNIYKEILELQEKLFAQKDQSILLVFQAMDAAGKDSTIRNLTTRLNVQGSRVQSFGKPSKKELGHDFLWRVHQTAPQKGEIVLFNRSHYEDVLIVKVHNWASPEIIEKRYSHINNFEALLSDSGTRVVKIMLNVSSEYQLTRFKNRLEKPEKNWKFNPADLEERKYWSEYMAAFSDALLRCSSEQSPWYVVPSEQRWFRDYAVANILLATLKDIAPDYPEPDYDHEKFTVHSIF